MNLPSVPAGIGALWIAALVSGGPFAGGAGAAPPAGGDGTGESYWGEIPALSDSIAATFTTPGLPWWEASLTWSYRVVTFPVKLTVDGVGEGVSALDRGRVVGWVVEHLGPRDLPFGFRVNLTAGGIPGFGGGVTFYHNALFGPGNRFELRGSATAHGSDRVTLGMTRGGTREIEIGGGYRVEPGARYFGIGPGTAETRESFFTLQQTWIGISSLRRFGHGLGLEGSVLYSEVGARGPGEEDHPSLPEAFATPPPGYGRTSDGFTLGVSLIHEDGPVNGRPDRGGYRRVKISRFEGVGGENAAFWTYRAEAQQFLPLWFDKRALALRGFASWIDPRGKVPVPFQRLMTNDDPDLLRGYRDFRWRDRGMAVLSVEYRWPVWAVGNGDGVGVDAYLFTDLGQVFGRANDLSLDHLTRSYGAGLRLGTTRDFLARFEVGWSEEETTVRFRADQVFQFSKGDLFHGRNPVPDR
jgi:hypothetical protein